MKKRHVERGKINFRAEVLLKVSEIQHLLKSLCFLSDLIVLYTPHKGELWCNCAVNHIQYLTLTSRVTSAQI